MMYLYVGSIVAIMCIYITVLFDNCPGGSGGGKMKGDPETGSVGSFGTLRRTHIDRNKVSRTSFYLRVGALGERNRVSGSFMASWSEADASSALFCNGDYARGLRRRSAKILCRAVRKRGDYPGRRSRARSFSFFWHISLGAHRPYNGLW